MAIAEHDVDSILDQVRARLEAGEQEGVKLRITNHKLDDDWLYIVVVPTALGVRASEYANYMSKVERELRGSGHDNVLLVPALED